MAGSNDIYSEKCDGSLMIHWLLADGTDPSKVKFDSYKSDLQFLLANRNRCTSKVKCLETTLNILVNSNLYAKKGQTIINGYIRTQSELEDRYVPQDLSNMLLKHICGTSKKLKLASLEFLSQIISLFATSAAKTILMNR